MNLLPAARNELGRLELEHRQLPLDAVPVVVDELEAERNEQAKPSSTNGNRPDIGTRRK